MVAGPVRALARAGSADGTFSRPAAQVPDACGAHAGDPRTMRESVDLAVRHEVAIGAHVGLADREGFGRRMIPVGSQEVHDLCLAQIGSLAAFVRAAGTRGEGS